MKYSEDYKYKLFQEQQEGKSYKEISDKYKVSYETCYYLINTIRNNIKKDNDGSLHKQQKDLDQEENANCDQIE